MVKIKIAQLLQLLAENTASTQISVNIFYLLYDFSQIMGWNQIQKFIIGG
jgi:hypothetical protein